MTISKGSRRVITSTSKSLGTWFCSASFLEMWSCTCCLFRHALIVCNCFRIIYSKHGFKFMQGGMLGTRRRIHHQDGSPASSRAVRHHRLWSEWSVSLISGFGRSDPNRLLGEERLGRENGIVPLGTSAPHVKGHGPCHTIPATRVPAQSSWRSHAMVSRGGNGREERDGTSCQVHSKRSPSLGGGTCQHRTPRNACISQAP